MRWAGSILVPFHSRSGIAALALLLAGPAHTGPLDGGETLCLYPVQLPIETPEGDGRASVLQAKLVEALEVAGFEVPDPDRVQEASERISEAAPASFDSLTGRVDEILQRQQRVAFSQALQEEFGCGARLFARVRLVWTFFTNGIARWDGRSVQISSDGRMLLNALGGTTEFGHVRALSLWLRVFGPDGEQLSFRSGGIEAMVNFAVLKDRDLLPEDQWLRDEDALDRAVALALGPGGEALRYAGDPHRRRRR